MVLEREGIPFELIVGTSTEAIIGAVYAIEPNAALVQKRVLNFFQPERGQNRKLRLLEKLDWPQPEKSDLFRQLMQFIGKEIALNLILVLKARDLSIIAGLIKEIPHGRNGKRGAKKYRALVAEKSHGSVATPGRESLAERYAARSIIRSIGEKDNKRTLGSGRSEQTSMSA